ncbi:MAG TPA: SprT family zinc-dependent metalloprotease [Syntrophales bacterium]|nr:SprT family zinc-dependent metalloprotease [Syntrophales bacterium]
MKQLQVEDITVDVVRKNIKNVYLRVYPPAGGVRVSVPSRMSLDAIRMFVVSKLDWIRRQQVKLKGRKKEQPREFVNRESHYFNGRPYLLKVIERNAAARVVLNDSEMELYVRPDTDTLQKKAVLDEWYRQRLKETVPPLIGKWEKKMGVRVREFGIKRMKTRWGTCNRQAKRIWLNLELAKRRPECLEYVVVHEMAHLLERNHGDRFKALMTGFMPEWRLYKDELTRFYPVDSFVPPPGNS